MLLLPGCLALCLPVMAAGQPHHDIDDVPEVEVSGLRDPAWKSYRALMRGMRRFEAQHALAPEAGLRFVLRARTGRIAMNKLRLMLVGDRHSTAVLLDEEGRFALPVDESAEQEGAELVLNVRHDGLVWRPDIRSPGTDALHRRLGDLRLECHVRWAVEKEEVPAWRSALLGLRGGPCDAPNVRVVYLGPSPISTAAMSDGSRALQLEVTRDRRGYVVPIHDRSWPDNARVVLETVMEQVTGARNAVEPAQK